MSEDHLQSQIPPTGSVPPTPTSPPKTAVAPGEAATAPRANIVRHDVEPAGKPAEAGREKKFHEPKDNFREIVETVVFVIVLVLLLKTFIAEAFVIPTGSMATTLLGYHKNVECPACHYHFTVNASREVEHNQPVRGCTCPNCRFHITFEPLQFQGPGEAP